MNLKLLRSLPSEGKYHALIWRNKAEIETINVDDLYNNLKIYEPELTGSSNTSQNTQNVAFVSNSTNNTNNTHKADDSSHEISTTHTHKADDSSLQEMAMLIIKARRFIKRTGNVGFQEIYQAKEEQPTNHALMAFTSSGSSSSSESEIVLELRHNALDVYKLNLEKAEAERDQLKQTLEKFQNSSKSLNEILECQVIDKFKKGLGYNAATPASPTVEGFVNLTDKSGLDKAYHVVSPPLTRNFIPRKPDLTFIDEIVESENLDVTTVVTPSNDKTVADRDISNTVESNVLGLWKSVDYVVLLYFVIRLYFV
ncbi:hypothetical protein Tco_1187382 [Tanacetum coccineum]